MSAKILLKGKTLDLVIVFNIHGYLELVRVKFAY
jgi:hypothetical protein